MNHISMREEQREGDNREVGPFFFFFHSSIFRCLSFQLYTLTSGPYNQRECPLPCGWHVGSFHRLSLCMVTRTSHPNPPETVSSAYGRRHAGSPQPRPTGGCGPDSVGSLCTGPGGRHVNMNTHVRHLSANRMKEEPSGRQNMRQKLVPHLVASILDLNASWGAGVWHANMLLA